MNAIALSEPIHFRELTADEINAVSGAGVLGGAGIFAIGVAGGLTANYIYEKAGGAEGIEDMIQAGGQAAGSALYSAWQAAGSPVILLPC